MYENVKSHRKYKIIFWPNIKCDIPGNILVHMQWACLCAHGWVLKDHGISFIMEINGSEGARTLCFVVCSSGIWCMILLQAESSGCEMDP